MQAWSRTRAIVVTAVFQALLATLPLATLAAVAWGQDATLAPAPAAAAPATIAEAAPAPPDGKKPDPAAESAAKPGAPAEIAGGDEAAPTGEVLSFRQAKVAAQMAELEQRMYRLAEALKAMEPENASRLMLGLKLAREELILLQMKEAQQLLSKLSLNEAVVEEKQLLAKLERLHELLLSADLDFQMQLERLRLMREILRRMEKAIQEEGREQNQSQQAAERERKLEGLKKRLASLEELIKRQREHLEGGRKLAEEVPAQSADQESGEPLSADQESGEPLSPDKAGAQQLTDPLRESLAKLADDQKRTGAATGALAAVGVEKGRDAGNLVAAQSAMELAADSLSENLPAPAVPHQEQALAALEKGREAIAEEAKKLEEELAATNYAAMRKDQEQNRGLSEDITQMTRELGESGAGALSELIRAGGNMSSAENQLGGGKPDPASQDQQRALESLKYAKAQLEQEAEKLLEQLRAEVKRRVLEGLTLMLERQVAIRESTEALGPRAAGGSRPALNSIVALAKSEGRIIEIANELITLVEETEFGIALPAALSVVRDAMQEVRDSLGRGDGSSAVVDAQREIESDLAALLEAMKQMPSSKPPKGKPRRGPKDQERELNRLIAELKMVRLLQIRVNRRTTEVDQLRSAELERLSDSLRQQIEEVADKQDFVRDATERLSAQRSNQQSPEGEKQE